MAIMNSHNIDMRMAKSGQDGHAYSGERSLNL